MDDAIQPSLKGPSTFKRLRSLQGAGRTILGLGVCRGVENTYPRTQNADSARVCGAGCLPWCGEHLSPDTECRLRQGVWGWVFAVVWRPLTPGHRMHTPPGCVGLGVCRGVENTYPWTQNADSARVCGSGCLPWCGEHLSPDTECRLRQGVWGWVFAVLWRTLIPGHRMHTPPGCVGLGVCRGVENTYPRTQNAHSARVCGAGCLPCCGDHLSPDTECTLRQGVRTSTRRNGQLVKYHQVVTDAPRCVAV